MGFLRDLKRWRFWRRFFTHAFSAVGALAVVAGLIDVFATGALVGQGWLIWLGLTAATIYGGAIAWPRPIRATFDAPRTAVSIIRGDLFAQDAHLVVGVSDTFDTAAPYIAPTSVQTQFANRIYGGDIATLDHAMDTELSDATRMEIIEKPGKTQRFELGTVVTLQAASRRFFLVAYSSMDQYNKAHGTADGLWKSLANLWSSVRIKSNGEAVAIPVIGGGQSGLSPVLPAEDAIRLIALSFIIASRTSKVCDELRIVALPAQYDRLNHLELRAFLSGLSRT